MWSKLTAQKLATELQFLRGKKGWTQSQLATKSGVSVASVQFIEQNFDQRKPRPVTLMKLAKALGVEDEVFLKYIR